MPKNKGRQITEKPKKKKLTRYEKNRLAMKIAGWIMATNMVVGVLMTFLMYFIV